MDSLDFIYAQIIGNHEFFLKDEEKLTSREIVLMLGICIDYVNSIELNGKLLILGIANKYCTELLRRLVN